MNFYGPSDIPTTDIEHYRKGYHLDAVDGKPGIVIVGQDEIAGYATMSDLAHAALMYDGLAESVKSENPADFFEMTDFDGNPFKVAMYAIQRFVADEAKRVAIDRIEKMTYEHVIGDARMRLLIGEFEGALLPAFL